MEQASRYFGFVLPYWPPATVVRRAKLDEMNFTGPFAVSVLHKFLSYIYPYKTQDPGFISHSARTKHQLSWYGGKLRV
jgi:hypothetical protein